MPITASRSLFVLFIVVFPIFLWGQTFVGVDPGRAEVGDTVVLEAEGGLDTDASYTLTVGETEITGFSVGENGITFTVPAGGTSGFIELTIDGVSVQTGIGLEVVRPVAVNLALPDSVNPADYVVGNFPDFDETGDGGFEVMVSAGGVQMVMAFREETDPAFLAMVGPSDNSVTISAESTALALAFVNPSLAGLGTDGTLSVMASLEDTPEVAALAEAIAENSDDGTDYLEHPEVTSAWENLAAAGQASLSSFRGKQEFPPASSGLPTFKTGTPKGTYILDIDEGRATDRSTQAELASQKDGSGYRLTFKELEEGKNPVAWILEVWELEPDKFQLGFQDVRRNFAGTSLKDKALNKIDAGFLQASLAGRSNLDFLDIATGTWASKMLAPAAPEKGPNQFDLPNRPGIYLVRAYSGNIWYGVDFGIVSRETQANLLNEVDENNAFLTGFTANAVFGTFDVLQFLFKSRAISRSGSGDGKSKLSDDFEGFLSDFFFHAVKRVNEGQSSGDSESFWYNLLKDFAGDLTEYVLNSLFESASTSGPEQSYIGKTAAFFKAGLDIFRTAAIGVDSIQRFAGLMLPNALALERSIVVVGNPFDPEIYQFRPQKGRTGDRIRIYGKNFGTDPEAISVAFCNLLESTTDDNDPTPPGTSLKVEAEIESINDSVIVVKVPEGMEALAQDKIAVCVEKTSGSMVHTRDFPDPRFRFFDYVGTPVLTSVESSPAIPSGFINLKGEDFQVRPTDTVKVNVYNDSGFRLQDLEKPLRVGDTHIIARAPNFEGNYEVAVEVNGKESDRLPLAVEPIELNQGEPATKLIVFVNDLSWTDDPNNPSVTILEAFKFLAGERTPTQHVQGEKIQEGEPGHVPFTPRETDRVSGDASFVGDPVTSPVDTNELRIVQSLRLDLNGGTVSPVIPANSTPPLASDTTYNIRLLNPLVFDFNGSNSGFVFDGVDNAYFNQLYVKNTGGDALSFINGSDGNLISELNIENAGGSGVVMAGSSKRNEIGTNPASFQGSLPSVVKQTGEDGVRVEGGAMENQFYDFQVENAGTNAVNFHTHAVGNRFTQLKIVQTGEAGIRASGSQVRRNIVDVLTRFSLENFVEDAGTYGVQIEDGAYSNYIYPARVFNATTGGVLISGIGTDWNYVGALGREDNPLLNLDADVLEQTTGFGVKIEAGAQNNTIKLMGIGGLNEDAVIITGEDTDFNVLENVELGYARNTFAEDGSIIVPSTLEEFSAPIDANGIVISGGASGNRLIDITTYQITGSGILITGAGTDENLILSGNLRGGDVASVHIAEGASRNSIGGDDWMSESNLILGGKFEGGVRVLIEGEGTEANEVIGNDMGRFFGGFSIGGPPSKPYEHAETGILIRNGAQDNVVGIPGGDIEIEDPDTGQTSRFFGGNEFAIGTSLILDNVSADLGSDGELLKPNRIQNNLFGTNGTWKAIVIRGNSMGNIIGGPTPEYGNSMRAAIPLEIVDNTIQFFGMHNRILNNVIGYDGFNNFAPGFVGYYEDFDDPCNLPPFEESDYDIAVWIRGAGSTGNIIGESILTPNEIRSMAIGVLIDDGATGNTVRGNLIYGNELGGVVIADGSENTIGGPSQVERNYIFDNGQAPGDSQIRANVILCEADENLVQNNTIGLDENDQPSEYNESNGLILINSANNRIGGNSRLTGNRIVVQDLDGIRLEGAQTTGNILFNNFIGTDPVFNDLGNQGDGIVLLNGASNNQIGGVVQGPIPGASGRLGTVSPNTIFYNGEAGVSVLGGSSTGNAILQNSFKDNGGEGIELFLGGNNDQVPPEVSFVGPSAITGTVPDLEAIPVESIIQLFEDTGLGTPQGDDFLGQAIVKPGGSWILFPMRDPTGLELVVTATHATTDDTSYFGGVGESASTPPFQIERTDGATPEDGVEAVFDGNGELEVLALTMTAGSNNPVKVTALRLSADGTAPDPLVIDGVCLYADTDESGTFTDGDTLLAGPRPFLQDNGFVILRPEALEVPADSSDIYFIVFKKTNSLGAGQTFNVSVLTANAVEAENQSPGSGPAFVDGAFPIQSDSFVFPAASGGEEGFEVLANAGEGGSASGGGIFNTGSEATLEATADEGFRFTGWTGDFNTRINPLTFAVTGPVSVTATFARQPRAFDRVLAELERNFVRVPGLGVLWMEYYPWVYKPGVGWVYVVEATEESVFLFIPGLGWVWTKPDADFENYFFRMSDRVWLYYIDGEPGSRRFYNFATEGIEEEI